MKSRVLTLICAISICFIPDGSAVGVKEQKFGNYMDRLAVSSYVFVLNPAVNRRIDEIGQKLAKSSGIDDIDFTFRIISSPAINAYSLAGGFVYVSTGILDILENEDEIAAVLGHEIAHTTESHQVRQMHSKAVKGAVGTVGSLVLSQALATAASSMVPAPQTRVHGSRIQYPSMTEMIIYDINRQHAANLGGKLGSDIGVGITISMIEGYGKRHELEADSLAVEYLYRAGYDPEAMSRLFQKIGSLKKTLSAKQKSGISHLFRDGDKLTLQKRLKSVTRKAQKIKKTASK